MQESAGPQPDHGAWEYEPGSRKVRWSEGLYGSMASRATASSRPSRTCAQLVHPDDRDTYTAIVRDAIETKTPFACQHRIVRPDGEERTLIVRGSFVEGRDEETDRLIGTTQDVTARGEPEIDLTTVAEPDSEAEQGSISEELAEAIGGHELRVVYQPIVSLSDGATAGCEALLRWEHPIKGIVGPRDFVTVAEETGLISKIGRFVLEQACGQAAEWRGQGRAIFVSVNVSGRQLSNPDLVGDVKRALEASGLPPELLCLEVSETSLLRGAVPVVESMRSLKALGVRLAVDDFGAGASSFGLLRILPIDQIKIDHSFIHGLGDTTSDRAVVTAILSLASELGLTVIAVGVEESRQQAELLTLGAELAQGYLYAAPAAAADLELDGFRI